VLALLVVTLAVAAWVVVLRGGNSASTTGFVAAEQRFATAAHQMLTSAGNIAVNQDLQSFDRQNQFLFVALTNQLDEFKRLASTESGTTKTLAEEAVTTGQAAVRALTDYATAVDRGTNLVALSDAGQRVYGSLSDLAHLADQWKQAS
jgi:hypothetical protein